MNKYKNYHSLTSLLCNNGLLLVSKLGTDFPFIIQKNRAFGLVIHHGKDIIYDLRYEIPNLDLLDVQHMCTYYSTRHMDNQWAIGIPFRGKSLKKELDEHFTYYSIHKQFSETDFPPNFEEYANLAITTGFPE